MASNGKPQSAKNIFQQQPKVVINHQPHGGVGQDKTALTRGSPASPQPEPLPKPAQSQPLNNKTERAKKHGSTKRKTVHLVLWVKPIVKAELKRIADQEGLSLSKTAGTMLARALDGHMDRNYNALLTPIIETAIDKRMRARDARLAWLLIRVAFDTGQTRAIVANILGRQQGMTEETLKNILAMSQRTTKGNITRRTPQIAELMEAVEKWLAEEKEPRN
jgi:hypothetical protein